MLDDDLAALSPVACKEVPTGELSRRLKSMLTIPRAEIDSIVESLVGLSLSDVVSAIQDPGKLEDQIQRARSAFTFFTVTLPTKTPSPPNSQDSRSRTSSSSGSVAPTTTSERERILSAVTRLEPSRAVVLTELLMGLPKRERIMCLFNVEVLRSKLVDAKAVLDSDDLKPFLLWRVCSRLTQARDTRYDAYRRIARAAAYGGDT